MRIFKAALAVALAATLSPAVGLPLADPTAPPEAAASVYDGDDVATESASESKRDAAPAAMPRANCGTCLRPTEPVRPRDAESVAEPVAAPASEPAAEPGPMERANIVTVGHGGCADCVHRKDVVGTREARSDRTRRDDGTRWGRRDAGPKWKSAGEDWTGWPDDWNGEAQQAKEKRDGRGAAEAGNEWSHSQSTGKRSEHGTRLADRESHWGDAL